MRALVIGLGVVMAVAVACRFDRQGVGPAGRRDAGVPVTDGTTSDRGVDGPRDGSATDTSPVDGTPEAAVRDGGDGAAPPGDGPAVDAGCPPVCAGCAGGWCLLPCAGGCTCPPGVACEIDCVDSCSGTVDCAGAAKCRVTCRDEACENTVSCGQATDCEVNCEDGSCKNNITCGPGRCTVRCNGGSCHGDINCNQACACLVTCADESCTSAINCIPGCALANKGCKDGPPTCDTCGPP